jgi:hypothetical protein
MEEAFRHGFKNSDHRIELSIRDIAPPHEFKDFSKALTAWIRKEPIGHINADGYRVINIEGRDYYMHDLVCAYMSGGWYNGEIQHINGNKDDNRWANLDFACDRRIVQAEVSRILRQRFERSRNA